MTTAVAHRKETKQHPSTRKTSAGKRTLQNKRGLLVQGSESQGKEATLPFPTEGKVKMELLRKKPRPYELLNVIRSLRELGSELDAEVIQEQEDLLVMSFYYGGEHVAYTNTTNGLEVITHGMMKYDDFIAHFDAIRLTTRERELAQITLSPPWNEVRQEYDLATCSLSRC